MPPADPALVRLTPLESHSGIVAGNGAAPAPTDEAARRPPADVLEDILVAALERPPCFVLFSGGRDSSLILAAAAAAARRHGLPDPIPLTAKYPGQPQAFEDDWQQATLDHVGISDARSFEVTDELDALGELATGLLRKHGEFWPSNAHTMGLYARQAGEGTLVTGGGGDELFVPWYWRRRRLRDMAGITPRRSAAKWTLYYALPLPARQRLLARQPHVHLPWLRPEAQDAFNDVLRAAEPAMPSLAAELELYLGSRPLQMTQTVLRRFAADEGAYLVEPFFDPALVRSVVGHVPRGGLDSRQATLEALFPGLLPPVVYGRTSKAYFTGALWRDATREFVAGWDGSGVDDAIVDPARLRAEWSKPRPDARTVSALHRAWLAANG